ncbi:MAG: LysR family transcriptional regulator [Oscillospiraceae bacterium]|nr:LysR family transcriptional regulator [Oscillospiraceae bacterium]
MDITQLRYFLKAAEYLNYTRAADEMYITRQSMRQAISAMEREIGRPLFRNTRNKLSLTEYGAYLAASAGRVLAAYEEMQDGLKKLINQETELRVACSGCLEPFILPKTESFTHSFQAAFPDIQVSFSRVANDAVIQGVIDGEYDCGFVIQMPHQHPGCEFFRMTAFDVALRFGTGCRFSGRRELMPEELQGTVCIGMGSLQTTMKPLWEECMQKGITFEYRVVPATIDAFYMISHENVIGFDISVPNAEAEPGDRVRLLKGYSFEVGVLSPTDSKKQAAISLYSSFIDREYQKHFHVQ